MNLLYEFCETRGWEVFHNCTYNCNLGNHLACHYMCLDLLLLRYTNFSDSQIREIVFHICQKISIICQKIFGWLRPPLPRYWRGSAPGPQNKLTEQNVLWNLPSNSYYGRVQYLRSVDAVFVDHDGQTGMLGRGGGRSWDGRLDLRRAVITLREVQALGWSFVAVRDVS